MPFCDYLQVQDLWIAGIGFDLGGAFLLARGLINEPKELTRVSVAIWNSNRFIAVNVAKNRLDAVAGVTGLVIGFALQAVGYIADLATPHTDRTGITDAATAAVLAVVSLLITVVSGTVYRSRRLIPLLVEMSHYTADERMPYPRAMLLPGWLTVPSDRDEGEDDLAFVNRVAGVDDLTVDVDQTADHPYPRTRRWTEPPLEGERP